MEFLIGLVWFIVGIYLGFVIGRAWGEAPLKRQQKDALDQQIRYVNFFKSRRL